SVVAGAVKFIFANVPASATAGDTIAFNVYAVDSFDTIDTSFNQDVTVTKTRSASGGGLVDIVNGTATTTITDLTAESVALGLSDTQLTGLGATDSKTVVFSAASVTPTPAAPSGGGATGVPIKPNPWVDLTFSGYVYPGATISLIRKDLGLLQGPVLQTGSSNNDGSFLLKVNHVTRLTGQTYILVFADRNGQVSQTRAYNIPAGLEAFGDENTVIAPSVGFSGDSIVTKGKTIIVQGYATPKSTVRIFVDGNEAGSVVVNALSGQYRYTLPTDNLDAGRHSVQARQIVGATQSDGSSQQSFTVSTLANPRLDLNGDGVIDIKDISIYLSYLKNLGADLGNLNTIDKNLINVLDINGDGNLNVQDLSILLRAIGR
ncbi:MAG TPA: dockerin type I repeat-containing protein, partial [Candidatus Paceibacterota bacterium]|nr:dockerin type I repeat-containing protein [Candidatus Paceibacterota bacterium]